MDFSRHLDSMLQRKFIFRACIPSIKLDYSMPILGCKLPITGVHSNGCGSLTQILKCWARCLTFLLTGAIGRLTARVTAKDSLRWRTTDAHCRGTFREHK